MTLAAGSTAWFDVMTFGVKLPWSHSNRKWASKHWTVILERNGKVVGDALENKEIVLKEQRKEKQFDGFKDDWRKITPPSPTDRLML